MALYFTENIDEKKEEPLKERIAFIFPWIIEIPPPDENDVNEEIDFDKVFKTNYKFHFATWYLNLSRNKISLRTSFHVNENFEPIRVWNGTCLISYKFYYDYSGEILSYESPQICLEEIRNRDVFKSPDGFLGKFVEAYDERKVAKLIVFVELVLPARYFYRPFEMPSCGLSRKLCNRYPKNVKKDFRFEFLKENDYIIKCRNGEVPALRMVLNISSTFMKHYLLSGSRDTDDLVLNDSIDVVKPIIIFMHSRCFQMPKIYDLDYVKRLLKVIRSFEPQQKHILLNSIHLSLCKKFIQESHDFDTILKWTSLAFHHSFGYLERMISTVIANKFYYDWIQTFPMAARNDQDPILHEIFGENRLGEAQYMFYEIENIMASSFITNVILD